MNAIPANFLKMKPFPAYFFLLLLLGCMAQLYGQEAENVVKSERGDQGRMKGTSGTPACSAPANARTGRPAPIIGLRAEKVKALSDSPGNLPAQTAARVPAKIDSLQSRLDSLPLDFARGKQAKLPGIWLKKPFKIHGFSKTIEQFRFVVCNFIYPIT